MPELPEVETVVRDLRPLLVHRTITAVVTSQHRLRQPWDTSWNRTVSGATVSAVRRRGKWILIDLGDPQTLLIHLGMTGQLTVAPAAEPIEDHTHLRFPLQGEPDELRFRDVRRFGSAALFTSQDDLTTFLDDRLGPEPFDIEPGDFAERLAGTNRTLKAVLLDQKVIAGVGNIYADEASFRARLHPERRTNTLDRADVDRLHTSIQTVLAEAIAGRGSTIRNYVGGSGLKGEFQHAFAAYGRTGDPCFECATPIEVVTVAGRSSHFCPRCQPVVTPRAVRRRTRS
jgi:formamidopyrimidine-DNA glycosylase